MKKAVSLLSAVILLCTMLTSGVAAFDRYAVYGGTDGCQLLSFTFSEAQNPWLMWDVTFDSLCDGRVLETAKDHPNLLGRTAVPTFTFEGDTVEFNGTAIESDSTEVVLKAENELIVYGNGTRAEYQVSITEETNGLPVVLIDTDGAPIPDKVNYVDTAISILGAETYGGEDIYAAVGGIKLRGNSTSGYDKKPYRIKFDKKQNVFGLGKAKSWVLLANYLDPAGLRNDLAYNFATRLNTLSAEAGGLEIYVPRVRPVEVYLNGEYQGLYDMGDHVQVDETRIDIDASGDEFDDNDVQLFPEGNVGYYLEIEHPSRVIPEWYSESAYYITIENSGGVGTDTIYTGKLNPDGSLETAGKGPADTLYVQIKTPEIPSEEQITYIKTYLQTVNDLILAQDEAVFDYIDMDGFINWYLTNELYKNTDSAFLSSIKMFKDKDGKLSMGPVWDFDIGSGAVAYNSVSDPTGWLTRADSYCGWYKALFGMESFTQAVEQRWRELRDSGIVDQIFSDIDSLEASLTQSQADNYALWHDSYINAVNNTGWLTVPSICLDGKWIEQVQYLRSYMTGRVQWFDEQFGYSSSSSSALGGKVFIAGAPEYESTLRADTLGITPYGASVSYQWYADGAAIRRATSSTFTPDSSYIGKAITVAVTGSRYKGTVTSEPVTLQKTSYTYKTSQLPPLVSKTHDTITVTEREGYEISVDGVNWQTSGTFTGLTPNTFYRVTYRHGETATRMGGAAGEALYVITDTDPDIPEDPDITPGDVDQSGVVNTTDVKLILKHALGTATLTGSALAAADFDGDGLPNTNDARALLKALVNS